MSSFQPKPGSYFKAFVILAQKQDTCLSYVTGICNGQETNGSGPSGPPVSFFNGILLTVRAVCMPAVSICHLTQPAILPHSAPPVPRAQSEATSLGCGKPLDSPGFCLKRSQLELPCPLSFKETPYNPRWSLAAAGINASGLRPRCFLALSLQDTLRPLLAYKKSYPSQRVTNLHPAP